MTSTRVAGTLQRTTGCRTRAQRRRRRCRSRVVTGRQTSRRSFTLSTPRLAPGRYRLIVIARDVNHRRRLRPTVVTLTVR
jgi:hypothetical protein